MQPKTDQDRAKIAAGRKAVDTYVRDGMKLGLGSGTTSHWFVRVLAEHVADGLRIEGVPTSTATRDLAMELGIPLLDLNDVDLLDVTIDGPDEIDHQGRMIKGGGACLLWEKMVAQTSRLMVTVADDSKFCETIGRFPLPVEIIRHGWRNTVRQIHRLLAEFGYDAPEITLRGGESEPVLTDSGHYIVDCHLGSIPRADELSLRFNRIAGVVENGLFIAICNEIAVGYADGRSEIRTV